MNARSDDDELFNVIKDLERSCEVCIRYLRSNPHPAGFAYGSGIQ